MEQGDGRDSGGMALAAINLLAGLGILLMAPADQALLFLAVAAAPLALDFALRMRPRKAPSSTSGVHR
jgi:hypothetical protein